MSRLHITFEKATLTYELPPTSPPAYGPHQNTSDPANEDQRFRMSYGEDTRTTNHAHQESVYELDAAGTTPEVLGRDARFFGAGVGVEMWGVLMLLVMMVMGWLFM